MNAGLQKYLEDRTKDAYCITHCVICNKEFQSLKRLKRMVCSIPCRNKLIGQSNAIRSIPAKTARVAEKLRLKQAKKEQKELEKQAKQVKLICPTCRQEFIEQKHHRKRNGTKFCSSKCYHRSEQKSSHGKKLAVNLPTVKLKGKLPPHKGVCLKCNEEFYAKYKGKKFCSIKCYSTSDQIKKMLQDNSIKVGMLKRAGFVNPKERLKKPCLQCGKSFYCKPKTYDAQKYCSRTCYRLFMADRFDRWVANPETIALPQCYDEFLTQDELPCLIEGCGWLGQRLGNHLNFTHGITANDFKALAGFNKRTGLVTPECSRAISERIKGLVLSGIITLEMFTSENRPQRAHTRPLSLEGKEHYQKSRAVGQYLSKAKFGRCLECGKKMKQPYQGKKLYCSTPCRSKYYYNYSKYEMKCGHCGTGFLGSESQQKRIVKDLEVFCSTGCRGARNLLFTKNHKIHKQKEIT